MRMCTPDFVMIVVYWFCDMFCAAATPVTSGPEVVEVVSGCDLNAL